MDFCSDLLYHLRLNGYLSREFLNRERGRRGGEGRGRGGRKEGRKEGGVGKWIDGWADELMEG